ncbi:hypothetical protein niasHS_009874 [Heterodera schachtii]|uniref:CCHC-type domain-containing protein n=1 Tax=Heterodera schachtii TaxID=97005 RepID=A0ABD2JCS5_HETSC
MALLDDKASHRNLDSEQIRDALLNVEPVVVRNEQQRQNEAVVDENLEPQRGGLRLRFQNLGFNVGREEWLVRNENFDGHRITHTLPPRIVPRTSTPIENRITPELFVQHVHAQNAQKTQNVMQNNARTGVNGGGAAIQQQAMHSLVRPQPLPAQQPIIVQQAIPQPAVTQPTIQQGFPGPIWGFPGQVPYYQYQPPISYQPQPMFGYMNTNPQQLPQTYPIYNPQYPPPYLPTGNQPFAGNGQPQGIQMGQQQVIQPVPLQQPQTVQRTDNFVVQNANQQYRTEGRQNQQEQFRGPGMDQVAYALIMSQISPLRRNEGAEKIKEFFKRFDVNTAEWSNTKRLTSLESKIFGRAERAFKSACSTEPYRYESIKREMLRQLEETDAREWSAFDQLMSGIRRKTDEDLDTLAERIIMLVRRAYPGLTDHLVDDYAIKHLIRTFDNSELALSLEMGRVPGMTFDQFVGMAARAEATQKATRRMALQNATTTNQIAMRPMNFSRPMNFFGNNSANQSENENRPTCFNCGRVVHVARNCFRPRAEQSGQNRNYEASQNATGANWTPMPINQNTSVVRKPELNFASQNRSQLPQSRNFLKQNYLVEQNEVKDEDVLKCGAVVSSDSEMLEFFKKFWAKCENGETSKAETSTIGKIVAIIVEIFGQTTPSMASWFQLFDAPNGELIEFECSNNKSESVRVVYNTVVEPFSTKFVELSVPPIFNDTNVLIIANDEDNSVRVEPALSTGRNGKIMAAITNFSEKAVILKENEEIAVAEEPSEIADAENCLEESWLFHSSPEVVKRDRPSNDEWTVEIGQLEENNQENLKQLLSEFSDVFACNDSELTQTEMVKHPIDTGNAHPIKNRMRPVPYGYREKVAAMLQDDLRRGIIRPSLSPLQRTQFNDEKRLFFITKH